MNIFFADSAFWLLINTCLHNCEERTWDTFDVTNSCFLHKRCQVRLRPLKRPMWRIGSNLCTCLIDRWEWNISKTSTRAPTCGSTGGPSPARSTSWPSSCGSRQHGNDSISCLCVHDAHRKLHTCCGDVSHGLMGVEAPLSSAPLWSSRMYGRPRRPFVKCDWFTFGSFLL